MRAVFYVGSTQILGARPAEQNDGSAEQYQYILRDESCTAIRHRSHQPDQEETRPVDTEFREEIQASSKKRSSSNNRYAEDTMRAVFWAHARCSRVLRYIANRRCSRSASIRVPEASNPFP